MKKTFQRFTGVFRASETTHKATKSTTQSSNVFAIVCDSNHSTRQENVTQNKNAFLRQSA